ncbi:MAG: glycosyltransferase family 1 protein [Microbacteriaceae bacterium]|nr:MAG: glycosyltransferase family 1 protein [Microbacteriaceae bacterium]
MKPSRSAARVLVIDHTAELSGGEVALSRLLEAVDRERYDVRVLLLADGPFAARLSAQGIPVAVLSGSSRLTRIGRAEAASSPIALLANAIRTLALVPRISAAIRGAGAQLVVANTLKAAVLSSIAAPLAGRRWVWHLHDRIARDYLPPALVFGLRALARWAPRLVVANSEATRATLPRLHDDRVIVAYPGVAVPPAEAPLRTPPSVPLFGLLGRIAPTKGQLEFLRAAALLVAGHPGIRFSVIGDALFNDGRFADEIRAMPAALGIDDCVMFTGWLDDPTSAIQGLTALVHASPIAEPFGQVIVEAMFAGVPVIGTDAGGVREILNADGAVEPIGRGVTRTAFGLLVAPHDPAALATAMAWMAEHEPEREAMAGRARVSAAERFDIRVSASRTNQAWTRALGAPGRARRSAIVDTDRKYDAGEM